jgi:CRISPR-associated protein (Cas_Cmr3)
MTWYTITPAGTLTLGNLTPVGQNSGQVGCRWPPNGHQLAAALNLPTSAQLWGPFWLYDRNLYLSLPQGVYTDTPLTGKTENNASKSINLHRMYWQQETQTWQVQRKHQGADIEQVGGRFLISSQDFQQLWKQGSLQTTGLQPQPWQTLTLSHNRREDYQVVEDGGFYAEQTILLEVGWSLLVKVLGQGTPQTHGTLGAGRTPVVIRSVTGTQTQRWEFLGEDCSDADSAVLLTGALWSNTEAKTSLPYPPDAEPIAYAADLGQPWQSWKQMHDKNTGGLRSRLTPGEWLTPAGAIYRWENQAPTQRSGPLKDPFNRHVLGYGHLWLFKETLG